MIVDTDVFVDFFQDVEGAFMFINENKAQIAFSAVTEAELLAGKQCNDPRQKEKVIHVLSQFEKIPVDNPLVQVAADFRRKYALKLPDALIAATAFTIGEPLFTRNGDDFRKVQEITVKEPY